MGTGCIIGWALYVGKNLFCGILREFIFESENIPSRKKTFIFQVSIGYVFKTKGSLVGYEYLLDHEGREPQNS
jgi:hypothetical protein